MTQSVIPKIEIGLFQWIVGESLLCIKMVMEYGNVIFARYVLTLMVDGMRSVRSFHFDKSAASVLTTCVCISELYLSLQIR